MAHSSLLFGEGVVLHQLRKYLILFQYGVQSPLVVEPGLVHWRLTRLSETMSCPRFQYAAYFLWFSRTMSVISSLKESPPLSKIETKRIFLEVGPSGTGLEI